MGPLCIFLMLLSDVYQLPAVVGASGLIQDSGIVRAEVGQNVTLKCVCHNDNVTFFSWYQQSLGGKPNVISKWMKGSARVDIYPDFKQRFHVLPEIQANTNHLVIRDVRPSDSAAYYCGIFEFKAVDFGKGAFLHVKTSLSKTKTVVRQPAVVSRRPGDSVSLNCTVYAEHRAGGQSLFWLRYAGSQPAILHPSEERCADLTGETPHMRTCTLALVIRSVSSLDPGIYYCALASHGEVVFGNGTRLELVGNPTRLSLLGYCLSTALVLSITVLLALTVVMYKLKKKLCSDCKGSGAHVGCAAASDASSRDADTAHYAALSLNRSRERRLQESSTDSVCVYARVKSRKSEAGLQTQLLQ